MDRQHHKRQEIVYHAENDRKRCVDQRKLRKMEKAQNHIDDTVFFQQILPCECPQQKIHPHGKNEDQYNETGLIDIFFGQDHGKRVSKDQADERTHEREQQCQSQCF